MKSSLEKVKNAILDILIQTYRFHETCKKTLLWFNDVCDNVF